MNYALAATELDKMAARLAAIKFAPRVTEERAWAMFVRRPSLVTQELWMVKMVDQIIAQPPDKKRKKK